MKILRFERNNEAVAWAKKVIGLDGVTGDVTTVSLVDDAGKFVAVTVFSAYTGTNIDMHIAARPKSNWVSRSYFRASFELPFMVLEVPRVTGLIRAENLRAQRFVTRLGFQYEGRMRKAFPDGGDLTLYGLLREDYLKHPWSKHETNGEAALSSRES
jgi:RimJ/RimL family protein N-acetyltransferase